MIHLLALYGLIVAISSLVVKFVPEQKGDDVKAKAYRLAKKFSTVISKEDAAKIAAYKPRKARK